MIEYQMLGMIEKITGNKIPEIHIDYHKNTYHYVEYHLNLGTHQ